MAGTLEEEAGKADKARRGGRAAQGGKYRPRQGEGMCRPGAAGGAAGMQDAQTVGGGYVQSGENVQTRGREHADQERDMQTSR